MPKNKLSNLEKEQRLQAKIAKMQEALDKLKTKRRQQLATILEKHGLDKLESDQLEKVVMAAATEYKNKSHIQSTLSLPLKDKSHFGK